MELYTKRLRMRPYTKKDFAAVHSYGSDPETVKYVSFGPNKKRDTKDFLSHTITVNKKLPRQQYDFAIELRSDGRLIGGCGLNMREPKEAEAGWMLHKDHWNNGYATEAAMELLDFAFSTLKLNRVYSRCFALNHGSWRVMEKCGMQREAVFRKKRKLRSDPNGPWHDEYVYAILCEDWKSNSGNAL